MLNKAIRLIFSLLAVTSFAFTRISLLHMSSMISQQGSKGSEGLESNGTNLDQFLTYDYKPSGNFVKLKNDIEFYGVGSSKSKNGVIVIPDMGGNQAGNVKNIADFLASNDTFVAIPTILGSPKETGDTLSYMESNSFGEFTKSQIFDGNMKPKIVGIAKYMFDQGVEKIALLGFSWGGWIAANMLADNLGDCFVCGVLAHPSINLEERLYSGTMVDLFAKIQRPLLLLPARGDPMEYDRYVQLLKYKFPTSDVIDYRGFDHNFLMRGRLEDPDVLNADKKALQEVASFLQHHFTADMKDLVRETDSITGVNTATKRSWTEYSQETGQYMREGAEQMGQRVKQTGQQAQESLQSTAERVKQDLWQTREKAGELAQKAGEKTQEAWERTRDTANQAAESVKERIQQAGQSVGEYTKQTGESIKETSSKGDQGGDKQDR